MWLSQVILWIFKTLDLRTVQNTLATDFNQWEGLQKIPCSVSHIVISYLWLITTSGNASLEILWTNVFQGTNIPLSVSSICKFVHSCVTALWKIISNPAKIKGRASVGHTLNTKLLLYNNYHFFDWTTLSTW